MKPHTYAVNILLSTRNVLKSVSELPIFSRCCEWRWRSQRSTQNVINIVVDGHDTQDAVQVSRTNSMHDRKINQKILNFVTARARGHPKTSIHNRQDIILKIVGLNKVRLKPFPLNTYDQDARGNAYGSSCDGPVTTVRFWPQLLCRQSSASLKRHEFI